MIALARNATHTYARASPPREAYMQYAETTIEKTWGVSEGCSVDIGNLTDPDKNRMLGGYFFS
jgi:hypothetical protein